MRFADDDRMGSIVVATRTAWLTALTGGAVYANPEIWVQLHLGDPGVAGTANPAVNTQRQRPTWGTASAGSVSNSVAVTWVAVPATENYSHISLWSLAVGGTVIGTDELAAPIAATSGGSAAIAIGALVLAVT